MPSVALSERNNENYDFHSGCNVQGVAPHIVSLCSSSAACFNAPLWVSAGARQDSTAPCWSARKRQWKSKKKRLPWSCTSLVFVSWSGCFFMKLTFKKFKRLQLFTDFTHWSWFCSATQTETVAVGYNMKNHKDDAIRVVCFLTESLHAKLKVWCLNEAVF